MEPDTIYHRLRASKLPSKLFFKYKSLKYILVDLCLGHWTIYNNPIFHMQFLEFSRFLYRVYFAWRSHFQFCRFDSVVVGINSPVLTGGQPCAARGPKRLGRSGGRSRAHY
jgi:hypothetical protein